MLLVTFEVAFLVVLIAGMVGVPAAYAPARRNFPGKSVLMLLFLLPLLIPLLVPGVLAALLLVLVRTMAMFELTFLTAEASSQTLVVALYYAVFAPRPNFAPFLTYPSNK